MRFSPKNRSAPPVSTSRRARLRPSRGTAESVGFTRQTDFYPSTVYGGLERDRRAQERLSLPVRTSAAFTTTTTRAFFLLFVDPLAETAL